MAHWWTYMWCRQIPPRPRRTCCIRGVCRDHGRRRPRHQQHSPGPPKDNHQGRRRQHPAHSRNLLRHQGKGFFWRFCKESMLDFPLPAPPAGPAKAYPRTPRQCHGGGYPVVSPRTATPATALTNRASCPRRAVLQYPRCSHVTVGWGEACMT